MSAELTDLQGPSQLWGEQYNRPMSDIFALQESIARDISEQLQLRLTPDHERELGRQYTSNSRAYDLYLRSVFYGRNATRASVERARAYAEQAIAEDPAFPLAYVAKARAYGKTGFNAYGPPAEAYGEAKGAAERALELDPNLAEAHALLAMVATYHEWDWEAAEREIARSRELDPDSALGFNMSAYWLAIQGRLDDALVDARRSRELEPLNPGAAHCVAFISFLKRDYETALAEWQRAREMQPDYLWANVVPPLAYSLQGRHEDALRAWEEYAATADGPRRHGYLAFIHAREGNEPEAHRALAQTPSGWSRIGALAALGDRDAAFAELEQAFQTHDSSLVWVKTIPILDPLRADPRFDELVRKMGL